VPNGAISGSWSSCISCIINLYKLLLKKSFWHRFYFITFYGRVFYYYFITFTFRSAWFNLDKEIDPYIKYGCRYQSWVMKSMCCLYVRGDKQTWVLLICNFNWNIFYSYYMKSQTIIFCFLNNNKKNSHTF
jgi:hypothetical protein